jgi:hypothetical protein
MPDSGEGWWGTCRVVDPPKLVWVRLAQVLPPARFGMDRVPLRVRQSGIDISATVPGVLVSWHQTITGDWWAKVRIEVTNRGQRAQMDLTQLVPAKAVSPRE